MGLKSKVGILILTCAVLGIALFVFIQNATYSTESVMDGVWNKYGVQSTMIGDTDPILDVSVYDETDIKKVENYLMKSLSRQDLEHYKLNVYEFSFDANEYKKNAQENLN